jgi:hypothetical protein
MLGVMTAATPWAPSLIWPPRQPGLWLGVAVLADAPVGRVLAIYGFLALTELPTGGFAP